MSTEPQKIKIGLAIQICKDIEALHKRPGIGRFYDRFPGYKWQEFTIRVVDDKSEISASRHERQISQTRRVPCNLWTILFDTYGNYKMDPVKYRVTIKNNGIFPHAPIGETRLDSGLAARIIYNKMKKENKLAWEQIRKQSER